MTKELYIALCKDYDSLREKAIKMKSILERLAPEDGITEEHDHFSHSINCVFCGSELIDNPEPHTDDCPWVEARKLLEELK
jgi:hypothetical protein